MRLSGIPSERRVIVHVRLTHKLADRLDGVDVSQFSVGDVIDLPESEAAALIREGWVEIAPPAPANPAGEKSSI